MSALLLVAAVVWIAGGVGRSIVGRAGVLNAEPLERWAFSAAFGLGVVAYGALALGLCGALSLWPVTCWLALLAIAGLAGMVANSRDAARFVRDLRLAALASSPGAALAWLAIAACAVIALVGCFVPPAGHEWDALAYHLADPKVFVAAHRIWSLPTEHHSNFPFTAEMWYAVALLYGRSDWGYAAAAMFHWATAALTVCALVGFARRMLTARSGVWAALIFVTTPAVLWESHVAYNDLAVGLYVTLGLLAACSVAVRTRGAGHSAGQPGGADRSALEWALLAAGAIGFALGTKYTALLPLALAAALLVLGRASVRTVALYACVALAIGSPWYIKSVVTVGNPVYPFFYTLFPHSKYWSADRAEKYSSEQGSFGFPHSLNHPAEAAANLAVAPYRLVTDDAYRFANTGDYTFSTLVGGLYAGFCLALALLRRVPRAVVVMAAVSAVEFAFWFFNAQIGRYLVSVLPPLALVAGYTAERLVQRWNDPRGTGADRAAAAVAAAALAGQAALAAWSMWALPTTPQEVAATGLPPTAFSAQEGLEQAADPAARDEALHRRLDVYDAEQWVNENTPHDAGIALFDETRGFYLDRPYLWANGEHSSYIPYDRMRTGADLTGWMRAHGIRYALVNLNFAPMHTTDAEFGSPNGREQEALQRWYIDTPQPQGYWRALVRDALEHHEWTLVYSDHGVAVLDMSGGAASA